MWTFAVWALVAGAALFWGLKLFVTAPQAPRETTVVQAGAGARGDLTRLFGVDAPPPVAVAAAQPAVDARFQLVGVVSPRSSQAANEGLALIAIDGKPAKAYRIGAAVDGGNVLQSVQARSASLGPRGGASLVSLQIPALPLPATGSLPSLGGGAAPTITPTPGAPGAVAAPAVPFGMRPGSGPGMPGWRPPVVAGVEGDAPPPAEPNRAGVGPQLR